MLREFWNKDRSQSKLREVKDPKTQLLPRQREKFGPEDNSRQNRACRNQCYSRKPHPSLTQKFQNLYREMRNRPEVQP